MGTSAPHTRTRRRLEKAIGLFVFDDEGDDLGGSPAGRACFIHDHEPACLCYRGPDGVPSRGTRLRGSTTSRETPSSFHLFRHRERRWTICARATTVTSVPSLFTSALPRGMVYSSSGTSPVMAPEGAVLETDHRDYCPLWPFSAVPFASLGVLGSMIFRPGVFMYMG